MEHNLKFFHNKNKHNIQAISFICAT